MPSTTTSRALATVVWPQSTNRIVQAVVLILAGTALMTLSAKVQVPFHPVPMTLQTLAVMAISAAYGSRLAVATMLAYLAEGAAGIPVFAGAAAGPAYLIGPTGGFLLGFVVAAAIIGLAADSRVDRSVPRLFAVMVLADAIVFVLGLLWLGAAIPTIGYSRKLLEVGLDPFILGDLLKIVLAALAIPAAWMMVDRRGGRSP